MGYTFSSYTFIFPLRLYVLFVTTIFGYLVIRSLVSVYYYSPFILPLRLYVLLVSLGIPLFYLSVYTFSWSQLFLVTWVIRSLGIGLLYHLVYTFSWSQLFLVTRVIRTLGIGLLYHSVYTFTWSQLYLVTRVIRTLGIALFYLSVYTFSWSQLFLVTRVIRSLVSVYYTTRFIRTLGLGLLYDSVYTFTWSRFIIRHGLYVHLVTSLFVYTVLYVHYVTRCNTEIRWKFSTRLTWTLFYLYTLSILRPFCLALIILSVFVWLLVVWFCALLVLAAPDFTRIIFVLVRHLAFARICCYAVLLLCLPRAFWYLPLRTLPCFFPYYFCSCAAFGFRASFDFAHFWYSPAIVFLFLTRVVGP